MQIASLSNIQYKYHSPLPFSGGKRQPKFSMKEEFPDVHAFYEAKKTYDPKLGSISSAPDEVQDFYKEITPELNKFRSFYNAMKNEEKEMLSRISYDINNMHRIATSGKLKSNAKIEFNENGYSYKEYDGRYITREITKSPKKLRVEKADGNNKKTITVCDIKTDPETEKITITKIKHTVGYHKTAIGGESYDKEYIFENGKLKSYTKNFSSDGKGNGKTGISATFGEKMNTYFENIKHIAKEGSFVEKSIHFNQNGRVGCYMKNPIRDAQNILTYEQKMEFEGGQPSLYIREGVVRGKNSEDTYERYAKFQGANWCFLY